MKKLVILLCFLVSMAFAEKPTVFEICNSQFCYDLVIENLKKIDQKVNPQNGQKFVRLYLFNNRILDVNLGGKSFKKKK